MESHPESVDKLPSAETTPFLTSLADIKQEVYSEPILIGPRTHDLRCDSLLDFKEDCKTINHVAHANTAKLVAPSIQGLYSLEPL